MTRRPAQQTSNLTEIESKFLHDAAQYLENPTWLMTVANKVGKPLEWLFKGLEKVAPDVVERAVSAALRGALAVAVSTIRDQGGTAGDADQEDNVTSARTSTAWWHKLSVTITGAAGGLFGLPGVAVELPITTAIMLRSIAATARELGEDLSHAEVRLQCLTVFAYGGPSSKDDALETTYLTARLGLQSALQPAAKVLSTATAAEVAEMIEKGTAPAVVNLIVKVANRFNVAVAEKVMAQSIPILGASAGAAINVAFIDHFNRVARFHFGIRSLERKYGEEHIQSLYREAARTIKHERKPTIQALRADEKAD